MIADRRGSASASAEAARAHEGLGRDANTSSKEVNTNTPKRDTQLYGIIHKYKELIII